MKKLFVKLLPGLLPILVFIIVDEFLGTKAGIIAAIAFGAIESALLWFKNRQIDRFIIFDTLLIVTLGGISILFDSDVFFKLKPALIGVIISLLLGLSSFTRVNFMMLSMNRYLKDIKLNDFQIYQMTRQLQALFFIMLFHTLLVFYSVWFMSDKGWAFVSGVLLYLLIGAYFVFEFVKTKYFATKINNKEWLPIVDEAGKLLGKATRNQCHKSKLLLHPVVHLHVLDSNGNIFLQKRSESKSIQAGKWDTAVGGHVDYGETIENGLFREAYEELGMKRFTPELWSKYIWESEVEREFVFAFVTKSDEKLQLNPDEISEGRFWTKKEILNNLDKNIFTPNFIYEYKVLFEK